MTDPDADLGLLEGLATTRAIRRYRDEPIPEDDLNTILWSATRAAQGSNRQGFRFLVLRDGPRAMEARALLGDSGRAMWAAKRRADGYESGSGVREDSPKARMARTMDRFVENFDRAPVFVLAVLHMHRDEDLELGGHIYPAVQNLLLAARALGYGGVITGWHNQCEPELRAVLGIPDDDRLKIAATIPLGKPEGRHGPVRRRPITELVFEDGWEEPAPWAADPEGTRFTGAGPPKQA